MDYINGIYCFVGQHAKQQRRINRIKAIGRFIGQFILLLALTILIGLVW